MISTLISIITCNPFTFVFLSVGIFLTILTHGAQLRFIKQFFAILQKHHTPTSDKTITPVQALLTAMSTSLGMGSIVGPPLAIALGGPGALFWLLVYNFFGAAIKLVEVVFSVKYKQTAPDGTIIGGPATYLSKIHIGLGYFYSLLAAVLFSTWSSLQARTLAEMYYKIGVPESLTGIILASFILYMLFGGAKRIGEFSTKLVPVMCLLYLSAALFIIIKNAALFLPACKSIFYFGFHSIASKQHFIGASCGFAMQQGIFKGIFITEAGVGTAGIPHAMASTRNPLHQGILAMYSVVVDTFFCLLSGMITLVSGVWFTHQASNSLIFDAFSQNFPTFGPPVLITSITLFVVGTALGNSFNGSKNFAFVTKNKFIRLYYCTVAALIFYGAITNTHSLWNKIDMLVPFVAIPNIFGIILLAVSHRGLFKK